MVRIAAKIVVILPKYAQICAMKDIVFVKKAMLEMLLTNVLRSKDVMQVKPKRDM